MTLFTGTFSLSEEITYTAEGGTPAHSTWTLETSGTITLDLTDVTSGLAGTVLSAQVHFLAVNTWNYTFDLPPDAGTQPYLFGTVAADQAMAWDQQGPFSFFIPYDIPPDFPITGGFQHTDPPGAGFGDSIALGNPVWTDSTHTGFTADMAMAFSGPDVAGPFDEISVIHLSRGIPSVNNVVDFVPI